MHYSNYYNYCWLARNDFHIIENIWIHKGRSSKLQVERPQGIGLGSLNHHCVDENLFMES